MLVYLDNSATTRPYNEVADGMMEYIKNEFGNPSSLHRMGIKAEKAIKKGRKQVGDRLGVAEEEIFFTSGGTEANNALIFGAAFGKRRQGKRLITSQVEHPSTIEAFKILEKEGFQVVYVGVDNEGKVNLQELEEAINDETTLISIMHVNNEVGTIQPISEIGRLKRRALFHTDAVQSYGKISIPMAGVDMLSLSGHKIHGPKGIGAMYIKKGINIPPYIVGGGQERGQRSGTENVAAIVGLGIAAEKELLKDDFKEILEKRIREEIENVKINSPNKGIHNILNVSFLGTRGEVILHTLEQEDIYVSTGSACSSNKKGESHVLKAMGMKNKEIEGAIRFSMGAFNSEEEIDYLIKNLKEAVGKFRRLGGFR